MTNENPKNDLSAKSNDTDLIDGALAAMRRATCVAQKRAIETTGFYEVWDDGNTVIRTTVNEELAREFEDA